MARRDYEYPVQRGRDHENMTAIEIIVALRVRGLENDANSRLLTGPMTEAEFMALEPWDGPKLPFSDLRQALLEDRRRRHLDDYLPIVRQECQRRIREAYGADDLDDEVHIRLRDDHKEEHDTERDRLRARYRAIKAWMTSRFSHDQLDQLESFDYRNEDLWTADTWTPPE